jgi:hypothetical protein
VFGFKNSSIFLQVRISPLSKSIENVGLGLYERKRLRVWTCGCVIGGREKVGMWKEPTLVQKWLRLGRGEIRNMMEKEGELQKSIFPLSHVILPKWKLRLRRLRDDSLKNDPSKISCRSTRWRTW